MKNVFTRFVIIEKYSVIKYFTPSFDRTGKITKWWYEEGILSYDLVASPAFEMEFQNSIEKLQFETQYDGRRRI